MLSSACYIPDAFPAALFLSYRHADDFAGGVISNALCGGDSCHRGAVVGGLLGGSAEIAPEWVNGLLARDRV
jgi:ADP-ribosylglycohydrolase